MTNPYQPPTAELSSPEQFEGPVDGLALPAASATRRFFAWIIDSVIPLSVVVVASLILDVTVSEETFNRIPDKLYGIAIQIPSAFIVARFEGSSWQASPGKKLLGLRVVRLDGGPVAPDVALSRNLSKYISLSICGLLGFTVLREAGNSWWDNRAATRVVRDTRSA